MAFQSSHSASAPSSTGTGGSEGGSDPNNQQNPNSPFSAAGSPPLILAFLAIGLFSAAMVVVFGWRRVHFGRAWALQRMPVDGVSPSPNAFLLTKKPKFWDVWNAGDIDWSDISGSNRSRYGWGNIMPLSATVLLSDKPVNEKRETPNPALVRRDQSNRRPLFHIIPRRPQETTPPGNEQDPKSSTTKATTTTTTTNSRLQVAVSIIMPSPAYPLYVKKEKDNRRSSSSREVYEYEYSIGVYSCAWPDQ